MAVYKGDGASPVRGVRIDGVVWQPRAGGGTLRNWAYPTSRPSSTFDTFNEMARQLDDTFHDLPPLDREAWEIAGADPRLPQVCLDEDYPFYYS